MKNKEDSTITIEDLRELTVRDLRRLLKDEGLPSSSNKSDLVIHCYAHLEKKNQASSTTSRASKSNDKQFLQLSEPNTSKDVEITYEKIFNDAGKCEWNKDLRGLPSFDFVRLYDYLVLTTKKYDHPSLRTTGYKKLKAYQFFKEGHIKDMQVGLQGGMTYVKAEVLASMKQVKYKAIVAFNHTGDVVKAACKCPAGRGVNGQGQCNHVGGILFAIEDFCNLGLKEHSAPVSCTSRLCSWNVPRNIKVDPKPVDDIVIMKYQYGKNNTKMAKSSLYDPRAPDDRQLDKSRLDKMLTGLSKCLPSSSIFLFHDINPQPVADGNVVVDSICEDIPEDSPDVHYEEIEEIDLPFNDDYNIASSKFKTMIDIYQEKVNDNDIQRIERLSRGQDNNFWRELKKVKLTASNFKAAATRNSEPDKLLMRIMYKVAENSNVPALQYGHLNEDNAVKDYVARKNAEGNHNLRVWKVGTVISKARPGYGASLDCMVHDPLAVGKKEGGLEIKCPYSMQGMTVEEACCNKAFCMAISDDVPALKTNHQYYYQVQGQMFVCCLDWVDFVVWFGSNNLHVQRIYFDKKWWYGQTLPRLDYFYKRAFLPEVLTKRVARGIPLYKHYGWKSFKNASRH